MKRIILAAFALLACIAPALAEDHLEPERTGMSSPAIPGLYDAGQIAAIFPGAFASDVKARLLELPSFFGPSMVGLHGPGDALKIFAFADERKRGSRTAGPLSHCDAPLPSPLGLRIVGVWRDVLLRTRYYPRTMGGADGAYFVFAMGEDSGVRAMSGLTWSPPQDSPPGQLVAVADAMRNYCAGRSSPQLAELDRLTAKLQAALKALR